MKIDLSLRPKDLLPKLQRFWELSAAKISLIEKNYDPAKGSPVFTVQGQVHRPRLDRVDAGLSVRLGHPAVRRHRRAAFLEIGRRNTVEQMAPHVTHVGVHDHGFNNVSTYGNLLRLMGEGRHRRESVGARTSTSWR